MKHLVQTACAAALIGLSSYSYAAVNGLNYDPAHSTAYINGQTNPNGGAGVAQMRAAIAEDLAQIKNTLNFNGDFNIIKTYYSSYCNIPTGQCIPSIAGLANAVGLKILLGVYEFRPQDGCGDPATCKAWTKAQVDAAIAAAKNPTYGKAVIGIVVGNEDMFDYAGVAIPTLQQRIVNDIKTIKAQVSVPVTTAQRQGDWCGGPQPGCDPNRTPANHPALNQSDPYHVLGTVQVIGANIFPYWGGSPEKIGGVSVATKTQPTALALRKALGGKGVIVTEEGWPSCASPAQHPANVNDAANYFRTWQMHANQVFDSYYFMGYDLAKVSECGSSGPAGDANLHFGLCATTGADKGVTRCRVTARQ
jgi:exo-beta-1,3-glucanase (GH17 family)